MPTYLIRHTTTYRYKAPVAFGPHRLLLRPRDGFDQRVLSCDFDVDPRPAELVWFEDASGNLAGSARFDRRARQLRFEVRNEVEQRTLDPSAIRIAEHAASVPFSYGAEEMADLARFIERQHPDPDYALDRWTRDILHEDERRASWAFLTRLNAAIRRDFAYLRREETGVQPPATTLRLRAGSCRDFAVLMIEAVRTLGFAARFVSGYLHVRGHDAVVAAAGGNTHAWLQVYLPGIGWVDFDPTSGSVGNAGLIRVAIVREPSQATPLAGSFMGFPSDFIAMDVQVDVAVGEARERMGRSALLPEPA